MIKSIEIENFKCFSKQLVPLNQITILTGVNAVGKSSIIQSLLLIRQVHDLYQQKALNLIQTIFSNPASDRIEYELKIMLNGPYKMNLGHTKEILNSGSNVIIFSVVAAEGSSSFKFDASKSENYLISKNITTDPAQEIYNTFTHPFYYLTSERLGPRNIQELIEQDFLNVGVQGEFTGYAFSEIDKSNLKLSQDDKRVIPSSDGKIYQPIRSQIENWMDYILPGIQINAEDYRKINSVRVSLKNKFADTDFLHPYNIGFGITYVLPIVITGLIAKPGSILIVENPEAHLHPFGQSKIGQFLAQVASSGVQVIVETHSEHVLNGIRIASLKKIIDPRLVGIDYLYFEDDKSMVKLKNISIDERGELSEWPPNFFDQEEIDLTQIYKLSQKYNGF